MRARHFSTRIIRQVSQQKAFVIRSLRGAKNAVAMQSLLRILCSPQTVILAAGFMLQYQVICVFVSKTLLLKILIKFQQRTRFDFAKSPRVASGAPLMSGFMLINRVHCVAKPVL